MLTEINLATLVSIEKNFEDKKELEKIILIKIPTEIYPTLYETFIYLFKQAGIKDINIEKNINFEKMYNERKKVNYSYFLVAVIVDIFYEALTHHR